MMIAARSWLVLALALAGCAGRDDRLEVLGTLERDRLELTAESDERLVELPVQEGDRVAAGALLARQEAGTMEPRLAQGRASLAEAERRLGELIEGPRAREVDEARASLTGAESRLATERREYERISDLVERKLLSASDLDQARARRDVAQATRDEARARLRLLQEGTRTEQIEQARAAVDRERAALDELTLVAERYSIRAPRPGLVEALPYEIGERPPVGCAARDTARRRSALCARARARTAARRVRRGSVRARQHRRRRRTAAGNGPVRLRAGLVHAVQLADAEGSQPAGLPGGDHARGRCGGRSSGRRTGAGPAGRWPLRGPARADTPAIEARGLTRRFGTLVAVDHVDLSIPRAGIYGFLGPNGSGKSTTIRMLCGLLEPTSGSVRVLGHEMPREAEQMRAKLGYMTQKFSLWDDLTVRENLQFMAQIHGLRNAARESRIAELATEFELDPLLGQRAGTMSGGQRQRLALAAATLHRPELLLLDEPTSAVDPRSRRDFWESLFVLVGRGTTILVSTHYMDEAERCHRLAILDRGRLVAEGAPKDLMSGIPAIVVEIEAEDVSGARAVPCTRSRP